jgi:hypothetical protein
MVRRAWPKRKGVTASTINFATAISEQPPRRRSLPVSSCWAGLSVSSPSRAGRIGAGHHGNVARPCDTREGSAEPTLLNRVLCARSRYIFAGTFTGRPLLLPTSVADERKQVHQKRYRVL